MGIDRSIDVNIWDDFAEGNDTYIRIDYPVKAESQTEKEFLTFQKLCLTEIMRHIPAKYNPRLNYRDTELIYNFPHTTKEMGFPHYKCWQILIRIKPDDEEIPDLIKQLESRQLEFEEWPIKFYSES